MSSLGIIINPRNIQEQRRWQNVCTARNNQDPRIVVLRPVPPNAVQMQYIVGNQAISQGTYTWITIIGHGGNTNQFLHGMNYDATVQTIRGLLQDRVSTTAPANRFRVQVCNAGRFPAPNPFHSAVTPLNCNSTAPMAISFIKGNQYIDFPVSVAMHTLVPEDLVRISALLELPQVQIDYNNPRLYGCLVPEAQRDDFKKKNAGERFTFLQRQHNNNTRTI